MIRPFIVILIVLWGLGMLSASTFGGFIHVLLAVALALLVVDAGRRRRSAA